MIPMPHSTTHHISLSISAENAVYMWYRFFSLLGPLKTLSSPICAVAVDGLGQIVTIFITKAAADHHHPDVVYGTPPLTNGNTILELCGERLFDAIFATAPSSQYLNDYERARAKAIHILCSIFCVPQFRETFDMNFVAKFYLAVRFGLQQVLQEAHEAGDQVSRINWLAVDHQFPCALIHGLAKLATTVHSSIERDPDTPEIRMSKCEGLLAGMRRFYPDIVFVVRHMLNALSVFEYTEKESLDTRETLRSTGLKLLGCILPFQSMYPFIPAPKEFFKDASSPTLFSGVSCLMQSVQD